MQTDADRDADAVGAKQLACAVITRAVEDISGSDRGEAIAFLTERSGPWARSRQFWASLADMDPDMLAERAGLLIT